MDVDGGLGAGARNRDRNTPEAALRNGDVFPAAERSRPSGVVAHREADAVRPRDGGTQGGRWYVYLSYIVVDCTDLLVCSGTGRMQLMYMCEFMPMSMPMSLYICM